MWPKESLQDPTTSCILLDLHSLSQILNLHLVLLHQVEHPAKPVDLYKIRTAISWAAHSHLAEEEIILLQDEDKLLHRRSLVI